MSSRLRRVDDRPRFVLTEKELEFPFELGEVQGHVSFLVGGYSDVFRVQLLEEITAVLG